MPRRPRILIDGGIYHVYNRITDGQSVFDDPSVAGLFMSLAREIKQRDGWTVFAWCLMPNHYHIVVRSGVILLSRGMRSIDGRFSQKFNRLRQRKGPLWQHRYQSRLVVEENYLRQLIVYVHLNPVRANITPNPAMYALSGHRELMVTTTESLTDMDDALLVFGESLLDGRHVYSESMALARLDQWFSHEVEQELRTQRTDRALLPKASTCVDPLGRSTGHDRPTVRPDLFVLACCELENVDFERVVSRRRDSGTARFRRLIATLGIERWRQRGSELAEVLNKHPDVVSSWASCGSHQRTSDEGWADSIDQLDRRLMDFWNEASSLIS
jgi:REP element-mobilizing transposase RayT